MFELFVLTPLKFSTVVATSDLIKIKNLIKIKRSQVFSFYRYEKIVMVSMMNLFIPNYRLEIFGINSPKDTGCNFQD